MLLSHNTSYYFLLIYYHDFFKLYIIFCFKMMSFLAEF
nr:MAG TPA: hypothetical protein [Bacteriophage sp.]DAZ75728.1 MAG TPA: hypothetical protein [Caudoviricetes sp.]